MASLVIEHEDFTLRFRAEKLASVLSKAAGNGMSYAGGLLYSDYSWSSPVVSASLEKDEADEAVDAAAISSAGDCRVLKKAPFFFENTLYQVALNLKSGAGSLCTDPKLGICRSASSENFGRNEDFLYGTLQFQNDIGKSDFCIEYKRNGIRREFRFEFHVLSSKLDYHSDWKKIVDDIESEYRMLSYDFLRRTYHSFQQDRSGTSSDMIWWNVFCRHREEFQKACRLILERPRMRYRAVEEYRRADQLRILSPSLENEFAENRNVPSRLYLNERGHQTRDTPENRFFKYAVMTIAAKHDRLAARIHSQAAAAAEEEDDSGKQSDLKKLSDDIRRTSEELKRIKNNPFFRGIGRFTGFRQVSLVLQQAPGYAQLMRVYGLLNALYDLQEGLYGLETKNIADLYELWCYIEVKNLVAEVLGAAPGTIRHTNRAETGDWFGEDPKKGRQSRVIVENAAKTVRLEVLYNPTSAAGGRSGIEGTRVPTGVVQKPDIVLRLTKDPERSFKLTYLFDAKYRLDGSDAPGEVGVPPDDAVNQMHRYRDAIYYDGGIAGEAGDAELKKEVIGGYILFPGRGEKCAIENSPLYKSIAKVNIGALPLRPGDKGSRDFLREFIEGLVAKSREEHILGTPSQATKGTVQIAEEVADVSKSVVVARYKSGLNLSTITSEKIFPCEASLCKDPGCVRMLVYAHTGGGRVFIAESEPQGPLTLEEFKAKFKAFADLDLLTDKVYYWRVKAE